MPRLVLLGCNFANTSGRRDGNPHASLQGRGLVEREVDQQNRIADISTRDEDQGKLNGKVDLNIEAGDANLDTASNANLLAKASVLAKRQVPPPKPGEYTPTVDELLDKVSTRKVKPGETRFGPTGKNIGTRAENGYIGLVIAGPGGAIVGHYPPNPDATAFYNAFQASLMPVWREHGESLHHVDKEIIILYPVNAQGVSQSPQLVDEVQSLLGIMGSTEKVPYTWDPAKDTQASIAVNYLARQTLFIDGAWFKAITWSAPATTKHRKRNPTDNDHTSNYVQSLLAKPSTTKLGINQALPVMAPYVVGAAPLSKGTLVAVAGKGGATVARIQWAEDLPTFKDAIENELDKIFAKYAPVMSGSSAWILCPGDPRDDLPGYPNMLSSHAGDPVHADQAKWLRDALNFRGVHDVKVVTYKPEVRNEHNVLVDNPRASVVVDYRHGAQVVYVEEKVARTLNLEGQSSNPTSGRSLVG